MPMIAMVTMVWMIVKPLCFITFSIIKVPNLLFFAYTLRILNNHPLAMSRLQRMNDALFTELKPDTLTIEDESSRHHVPVGSESHFKVTAVSSRFNDLNRIARHRLVNACLSAEFTKGLHALSLHLFTPDEWRWQSRDVPNSPACRNGKK